MIKVCKMVLRPLKSVKVVCRFLGFDGMNLCLDFKLIMSLFRLSINFLRPKKGDLVFFHFEKSNSGKKYCSLYGNTENQAKKIPDLKGS